jgi:hypothetical protein
MMLSDTQLTILSPASQRTDHLVVLPPKLNGAVALKVVNKLLQEGFLQEQSAKGEMPVWRRDQEHGSYSLRITKAGLQAITAEAFDAPVSDRDPQHSAGTELVVRAARSTVPSKRQSRARNSGTRKRSSTAKTSRKPAAKAGSKHDKIMTLLRRPQGATIATLIKATGWQEHSVRGFLAGTVRTKLKLPLTSKKVEGVRTYRITAAKAPKGTKASSSRGA